MNTRNLVVLLIFIGYFSGNAQNKKDVLLTINSNPIYSSDFTKVFNKNLDLVVEESQKNLKSTKISLQRNIFTTRELFQN
jgi:peptidyl-prolyl cis-trans isomerase SurA